MALHDRDSGKPSLYPAATAIAVFLLIVGSIWWESRDEEGAGEASSPAQAPASLPAPKRAAAP